MWSSWEVVKGLIEESIISFTEWLVVVVWYSKELVKVLTG